MKDQHDPFFEVLGIMCILFVIVFVSFDDAKGEKVDEIEYCRMVALHKKDPTKGWAPYKGEQFCPR